MRHVVAASYWARLGDAGVLWADVIDGASCVRAVGVTSARAAARASRACLHQARSPA